MFARIRWSLVGWTVLVLALILGLIGGAMYLSLTRSLVNEVDRGLATQADRLEGVSRGGDDPRSRSDDDGYRSGFFYVIATPDGQILANPQHVDTSSLPTSLIAGSQFGYSTISLNGESARVFVRPIGRRTQSAVLILGRSLVPEEAELRRMLEVFAAGAGGGLVLSLLGAWFLAGRALIPIQAAFRRQQEFVADASHEIRTPLTVIKSAHDILAKHPDDPLRKNAQLIDDVQSEIARMTRLTDDLLTLARSDQGTLDLAVGEVDVGVLAADVARRVTPLAERGQLTLVCDASSTSRNVEGDPDRLQQALLILLDNAIKHTPPGGTITVSVKPHGGDTLLAVTDTGEGIPPEHIPRLFDRFYRVDRARSRNQGGSGLGLAIARSLVEAHGGELTLSSALGVGTTARIRLPGIADDVGIVARVRRLAARATDTR